MLNVGSLSFEDTLIEESIQQGDLDKEDRSDDAFPDMIELCEQDATP